MITGGAVSPTVTRWVAVALFPLASVAVQVTIVVPNGKNAGASLATEGFGSVSSDTPGVPRKIPVAPPRVLPSTVRSGGAAKTGGTASTGGSITPKYRSANLDGPERVGRTDTRWVCTIRLRPWGTLPVSLLPSALTLTSSAGTKTRSGGGDPPKGTKKTAPSPGCI